MQDVLPSLVGLTWSSIYSCCNKKMCSLVLIIEGCVLVSSLLNGALACFPLELLVAGKEPYFRAETWALALETNGIEGEMKVFSVWLVCSHPRLFKWNVFRWRPAVCWHGHVSPWQMFQNWLPSKNNREYDSCFPPKGASPVNRRPMTWPIFFLVRTSQLMLCS